MTETDDAVEAATIRESIVRGFYGAKDRCLEFGGGIFHELYLIIC